MLVNLFCCNYTGECFRCSYGVRSFSNVYAGESFCNKYVGYNFYWNYARRSLQRIIHVAIVIVIMQATVSVVAMYVAVSSSNFLSRSYIPFSNWYPFLIKLTRKHQNVEGIISNLNFTNLVNIFRKLRHFVGKIFIKVG